MTDNRFKKWWERGFGPRLVGVIPHDAKLAPDSAVSDANRGKVPGLLRDSGWVGLGGKFVDRPMTSQEEARRWQKDGASVGIFSQYVPAADIDVNVETVARDIQDLAFEHLGDAPVRWRKKSARRLMMYSSKAGNIRKRRVAFMVNGEVQAVELLGAGQYYNIDGIHPSGEPYRWSDNEFMRSSLTEITEEEVSKFFAALIEYLDMMGYEIVQQKSSGSGSASPRKPLSTASLHAPSAGRVLEILAAVPCNDETFETRDEFIEALAAIKAALGDDREEHWPEVRDWTMQYPGATEEYVTKIWESIKDAALGWSYLEGWARGKGYTGGAQYDFEDESDIESKLPKDHPALNTALEKMLKRYAWVESLGRFYDEQTGHLIGTYEFNAANVDVADFGRSGAQTPVAIFMNSPDARKVATATSMPGEPMITTTTNEYGVEVSAVNLWRPSNVKPYRQATDEDVETWLDLVRKLFGDGTDEYEHFLNFWAYLLQNPGQKIGHALVIVGGQGVGKDSVLAPLFDAVGRHNIASIDTSTIANQWTHYLKAQVIYVQEMHHQGRRDQYNYLKPFISSQKTLVQVNEKGLRQYFVPNYQNWVITTNYDDAIMLDDDDRRFWVHRALISEPPGGDYFTRYFKWLAAGGTEKIFGWLLSRDVTGFDAKARPPMTAAKRAMVEGAQPATVRRMREMLAEGGSHAHRTVMTANDLSRADEWDLPQSVMFRHAASALRHEGFKLAHRARLGRDGQRQLWVRNFPGPLSHERLRDLYLAEVAEEQKGHEAHERRNSTGPGFSPEQVSPS